MKKKNDPLIIIRSSRKSLPYGAVPCYSEKTPTDSLCFPLGLLLSQSVCMSPDRKLGVVTVGGLVALPYIDDIKKRQATYVYDHREHRCLAAYLKYGGLCAIRRRYALLGPCEKQYLRDYNLCAFGSTFLSNREIFVPIGRIKEEKYIIEMVPLSKKLDGPYSIGYLPRN